MPENLSKKKQPQQLEAKWIIEYDGWYPVCSLCDFEPYDYITKNNLVPCICPKCGAIMKNADKLNKD